MVRASCFKNAYFLSEKFFLLYIIPIIQINGGFVKIYLNLCLCFFFYSSKRSKNRCAHTRYSASAAMFSHLSALLVFVKKPPQAEMAQQNKGKTPIFAPFVSSWRKARFLSRSAVASSDFMTFFGR